jgi:hypothetical protein
MAKIGCCHNCAYSYCDHEHALWSMSVGVLTWPACANHPGSFGRMQRAPARGICPNYRPRPATPEGEVKQIPLGDGFYAYVDAADYEWLSRWTWQLRGGYAVRIEKRKPVFMHRQIMQPPKGMIVDHKNLNKLDNTRANLRVCTHQENACNRSKKRGTFSRFRGVVYHKDYGKYSAHVYYKSEHFFLGYFTDEIEAARARDRKAVEVLGESARLNFPEEWLAQRRAEIYAQRKAVEKEGKKVRRKQAGTSGRPQPRVTGRKPRTTSARPRATSGEARDRARVRRQKGKGENNVAVGWQRQAERSGACRWCYASEEPSASWRLPLPPSTVP